MFSKAKEGDRVWSPIHGWGKVKGVSENVLSVAFENNGRKNYYWVDKKTGKYDENDINPAIYWQEFEIPKQAFKKHMPNLKVNTKVLVWGVDENYKYRRYFSHFGDNGEIYCFSGGATSWSSDGFTSTWENRELAEEENNEQREE